MATRKPGTCMRSRISRKRTAASVPTRYSTPMHVICRSNSIMAPCPVHGTVEAVKCVRVCRRCSDHAVRRTTERLTSSNDPSAKSRNMCIRRHRPRNPSHKRMQPRPRPSLLRPSLLRLPLPHRRKTAAAHTARTRSFHASQRACTSWRVFSLISAVDKVRSTSWGRFQAYTFSIPSSFST